MAAALPPQVLRDGLAWAAERLIAQIEATNNERAAALRVPSPASTWRLNEAQEKERSAVLLMAHLIELANGDES